MEEDRGSALAAESALEKNVAELTVMDVYDIASLVGHEFERVIDQHGCEAIARLMPKVVRVLEILEVLVSRHHVAPELDELRLELDRLRLEGWTASRRSASTRRLEVASVCPSGQWGRWDLGGPSALGFCRCTRTCIQGIDERRSYWMREGARPLALSYPAWAPGMYHPQRLRVVGWSQT